MTASSTTARDVFLPTAQIVPVTEAEGPGKRFALWFQGCPLRCPGCCNPEMLPFDGGRSESVIDVLSRIRAARDEFGVEGITFLGGEPFAHAAAASVLARETQALDLSVMTFSGYVLEEIKRMLDPGVTDLLGHTDILVDGPYLRDRPETERRWIGSANQRVHFLTARHRADDPRWRLPNTLEIRLDGKALTVNGFPAKETVGLWKRPLPIRGAKNRDQSE